jgi:hypothetical protein
MHNEVKNIFHIEIYVEERRAHSDKSGKIKKQRGKQLFNFS